MQDLLSKTANRFLRIADQLENARLSIDELARALDLTPSTVKSTVLRIEETLGERLVVARSSRERDLALTDAGHEFLSRLRELSNANVGQKRQSVFSISISQTMLTSGLLDGVFASLRESTETSLILRAKTRMQFSEVVCGIQNEDIDFAIVWGVPQRIREIPKELNIQMIASKVDVVVVARERSIIDHVNPAAHWFRPDSGLSGPGDVLVTAMKNLRSYSCAILPGESQAAMDLIPAPDVEAGGQHMEVDTIDAAISFVRCGAADYCVIPAIYDRLEKEQQEGKYVVSEPIAQIPLVVISRKRLDSRGTMILSQLLESLQQDKSMASWRKRKTQTDSFPRSYSFYEKLRYGYFIGADPKSDEVPLQWCWESIKLERESSNRRRTLRGMIVNEFGIRFTILSAQFQDTFFVAQVKPFGRRKDSVREFFTRFHYCDYKSGVLCGTWSGNSRDNRPGVFASVWSHEKLCLGDLSEITRNADLHSVMNARAGCEVKETQLCLVEHLGDVLSAEDASGDD